MKTSLAVLGAAVAGCLGTLALVNIAVHQRDQRLIDHYAAGRMTLAVSARKEGNNDLEQRALRAVISAYEPNSDPIGTNTVVWSFFSPVVIPFTEAVFGDANATAIATRNLVSVAQKRLKEIQ
jgi:hypothetical protein